MKFPSSVFIISYFFYFFNKFLYKSGFVRLFYIVNYEIICLEHLISWVFAKLQKKKGGDNMKKERFINLFSYNYYPPFIINSNNSFNIKENT